MFDNSAPAHPIPIFEGDTKPEPLPVVTLKKALAGVEHRLEEARESLRYHEGQIESVRLRVISWGHEAHALKTAIELLEKAS